jgi:predicted ATPase
MRVVSIQLKDYRAFETTDRLPIGQISVLVGANNTGKSSLIRAMLLMQQFQFQSPIGSDVRVGARYADVALELADVRNVAGWEGVDADAAKLTIRVTPEGQTPSLELETAPDSRQACQQLANSDPAHFIVPFLSRRKVTRYEEDPRRDHAMRVGPDLQNLAARLTRIDPELPRYETYAETCKDLVGRVIRPVSSQNGFRPGIYADENQTHPIYVDAMGEGVAQIAGLLADLVLSRGKLFLIEELEADLHPRALKRLLELIVESSTENQFVVSTHSNIVLRHLGAQPDARVYSFERQVTTNVPISTIRPIGPDPGDRIEVLRDLGYEMNDFDLWDAWLFLEEASAETVIGSFLIPWFVPGLLGRIRTLSAAGVTRVAPTFDDFYRLVRYTHLEAAYRDRAWVIVDGDAIGQQIVAKLRDQYPTWTPDRFQSLTTDHFESYYPDRFSQQRATALGATKEQRQELKRALLKDVVNWCISDSDTAKAEFATTASDVIELLNAIDEALQADSRS